MRGYGESHESRVKDFINMKRFDMVAALAREIPDQLLTMDMLDVIMNESMTKLCVLPLMAFNIGKFYEFYDMWIELTALCYEHHKFDKDGFPKHNIMIGFVYENCNKIKNSLPMLPISSLANYIYLSAKNIKNKFQDVGSQARFLDVATHYLFLYCLSSKQDHENYNPSIYTAFLRVTADYLNALSVIRMNGVVAENNHVGANLEVNDHAGATVHIADSDADIQVDEEHGAIPGPMEIFVDITINSLLSREISLSEQEKIIGHLETVIVSLQEAIQDNRLLSSPMDIEGEVKYGIFTIMIHCNVFIAKNNPALKALCQGVAVLLYSANIGNSYMDMMPEKLSSLLALVDKLQPTDTFTKNDYDVCSLGLIFCHLIKQVAHNFNAFLPSQFEQLRQANPLLQNIYENMLWAPYAIRFEDGFASIDKEATQLINRLSEFTNEFKRNGYQDFAIVPKSKSNEKKRSGHDNTLFGSTSQTSSVAEVEKPAEKKEEKKSPRPRSGN